MEIARAQAGWLHRWAGLLDLPASTVSDARAHCGYIQIDPINGCGRMHELIERIADNLALASKSSQALGQAISRNS